MWPASAELRAALAGPHRVTLRAEIWRGDQCILTAKPVAGSITDDQTRSVRRSITADLVAQRELPTVADVYATYATLAEAAPTYEALTALAAQYSQLAALVDQVIGSRPDPLMPGSGAADPLAPYGNELRVWRGVFVQVEIPPSYSSLTAPTYDALGAQYSTYGQMAQDVQQVEVVEEVPLGVFALTEYDAEDSGAEIRITVQGEDRSRRISRNRWSQPYAIAAGTPAVDAIADLLRDRWDDVDVVVETSSTATVGKAVLGQETDNDPWADARKIAKAVGLDVYFDVVGRAVITDVVDVDGASPTSRFVVGQTGTATRMRRGADAATAYNGWIVTGEGTSTETPVRAEAWDDDPTSPTWVDGPYGRVPRFYSSSMITTVEQAQRTAAAMRARAVGIAETLDWSAVVDPTVHAGDVALVVNPALRVSRLVVLDSVEIPLAVTDGMTATGRRVADTTDEENAE
jgi:hypothetical protein